jgi:hypothetical protein
MKSTLKILGIIALVAVIGFSMAACGGEEEDDGGGGGKIAIPSVYLNTTWICNSYTNIPPYPLYRTETITFTDSTTVFTYLDDLNDLNTPETYTVGETKVNNYPNYDMVFGCYSDGNTSTGKDIYFRTDGSGLVFGSNIFLKK